MNAKENVSRPVRPDEWGFYDPDRAGLSAVLDRLDSQRRLTRRSDDRFARLNIRDPHTQSGSAR